jgi:hypothetical protein
MTTQHDDTTTTCWCGRDLDEGGRLFLGVAWCARCLARILRSCPPAVFEAAHAAPVLDDEECRPKRW